MPAFAGSAHSGHWEILRAIRGGLALALILPIALLPLLAGCGTVRNNPINAAVAETAGGETTSFTASDTQFDDTSVGLSFSGGGSRASAFAFGVLRELGRTQVTSNGESTALIDQVDFVSSVSGGSVTAAYFA